ncbi:MAG TPA: hypothetical protein VMO47_16130 [Rhodothermales bacterium]|nr:hypothetical protein [Rhodothermales bacterium]
MTKRRQIRSRLHVIRALGLLTVLWTITAPTAAAQFPEIIAYQGYLSDAEGTPLDGDMEFDFRLFDAETDGSMLWNEVHAGVPVEAGVFSVQLGGVEPLAGVAFEQPLFLEVAFGDAGTVLSPRLRLTAVPYSLRAGSLDDGALVAGSNVSIQRQGEALRISASGGNTGTPTQLAASDGTPGDAVSVDAEGRVRIGLGDEKTSPFVAPVHIRPVNLGLSKESIQNPGLVLETEDANLGLYSSDQGTYGSGLVLGEIVSNKLLDQWSLVRETGKGGALRFMYGGDSNYALNPILLSLTKTGRLGIGTTNPGGLLHVSAGTSGDARLILEADTDNNNENDNPSITLVQDGGGADAFIAMEGLAGTLASGTRANALVIGSEDNDPAVQFVTNDQVRMTIGTDGSITAPARTSARWIMATQLAPGSSDYSYQNLGGALYKQDVLFSGRQSFYAQVQLPDGAVVTRVTSFWLDEVSANIQILLRMKQPGNEAVDMAVLHSSGSSGQGSTTDTSIAQATIDNVNRFYELYVVFPPGTFAFPKLVFNRVKIEYRTTRIH